MRKAIVTGLYALGALAVLVLCVLLFSHCDFVPWPEAMLPLALWELALNWLALGALPLWPLCVCTARLWGWRGFRRFLAYLPAIVCSVMLFYPALFFFFLLCKEAA